LYERQELSKNKQNGNIEKSSAFLFFIKEKLLLFSCFFRKNRKKTIDKPCGMVYNKN